MPVSDQNALVRLDRGAQRLQSLPRAEKGMPGEPDALLHRPHRPVQPLPAFGQPRQEFAASMHVDAALEKVVAHYDQRREARVLAADAVQVAVAVRRQLEVEERHEFGRSEEHTSALQYRKSTA